MASAIHGDVRRGSGILNNERYMGRLTWGRSTWRPSAADSAKRKVSIVEDPALRVTNEDPRLRIVPQDLWARVKARQKAAAKHTRSVRAGRPLASLLSRVLICDTCEARFIAVDRNFYGCASYKQGGVAACPNSARVRREQVERLLLAEIDAEILSDEAVAYAQKIVGDELRRLSSRRSTEPVATSAKISKLDAQASALRMMLSQGTISASVAQAGLDTIDRERAELVSSATRQQRTRGAEIVRVIPRNAQVYRAAVRNLSATVTDTDERDEARALIAELLGGHVRVRKERDAVYARLHMDMAVLLTAAANSSKSKDFQFGSGGRI